MNDDSLDIKKDHSINTTRLFWIERDKVFTHHEMRTFHYHDCYEVYYLLSGTKNLFLKDKFFRLSKGDLVFINAQEPHRKVSTVRPSRERYLMYINKSIFEGKYDLLQDPFCPFHMGSPVLSLTLHDQQYVEALLDKIYREYQNEQRNYMVCIAGLLMELLVFVIRCNEKKLSQPADEDNYLHRKISEVVQYINQHYADTLTLETLSSHFYISPYYLSRLFKTETGFSFVEYVASVRVKEAQRLLRETNWNANRISEEVGYGNLAHFYKVFKQTSALSPLQYRKRNLLMAEQN